LKLNGLEYHTLEPADADIIGKRLLEDNKKAYPHDFPPRIHEIALLTKYWYVHSQGLKKTRTHVQSEVIEKSSSSAQAILKELENSSAEDLKIEIALAKQVQVATATLRGHIKKLNEYPTEFQKLRAKFAAKAIQEPLLEGYKTEIGIQIAQLQAFLTDAGDKCAVAEILEAKTEEAILQSVFDGLQTAVQDAETHLLGAKTAKSRYVSLLA